MLTNQLDRPADQLRLIALARCFSLARQRGRLILQQRASKNAPGQPTASPTEKPRAEAAR